MALAQEYGKQLSSVERRSFDRLTLSLIGMGVIFASLGLGEAVYRFAFLDFDGATDRLPIEMAFGLAFAWVTTSLARKFYQKRKETSERIKFIRDRNYRIRHAVEAIKLVPFPTDHQAIRVIREEVDRIEWAVTEIAPQLGVADAFAEIRALGHDSKTGCAGSVRRPGKRNDVPVIPPPFR